MSHVFVFVYVGRIKLLLVRFD